MTWTARLLFVLSVSGTFGCNPLSRCRHDSDCPGPQWCEPIVQVCVSYERPDSGPFLGADGGGEGTLTYAVTTAVYTRGIEVPANGPVDGGPSGVMYSVSPNLPAGLTIEPSTGIISGTPTAVAATASYTVSAHGSAGNWSAVLFITVNDLPPSNLKYTRNPVVGVVGAPIEESAPSSGGGAIVSYASQPELPAGLNLNPTTGVVSGTPAAATATADYTITGSNSGGQTSTALTITIADAAPANLTYSANPAKYTQGFPIHPNKPSNGGGAVATYSVNPALPAGIALDSATGIISGTPTSVAAKSSYTITAANGVGSATVTVAIEVGLPVGTNSSVYSLAVGPDGTAGSGSGPEEGGLCGTRP